MDKDLQNKIKKLFDETDLEQLAISFLKAINEQDSPNTKKQNIIQAFLSDYLENYLIMIVNHTDTDEHLAEIFESSEKNLIYQMKRNLLKQYVNDFENREKEIFNLYVTAYKSHYAK